MSDLITLDEAKNILDLRDSGDDAFVRACIDGVTSVIEAEVGAVVKRAVVMDVRQCGSIAVALPETNIISLTSAADESGAEIDISSMRVSDSGVLRIAGGGYLPSGPWRLTAQVGMDPIPEAIRRAAAEVMKEAYAVRYNETEPHVRPFLISYRTMVWLEPYRTGPGFS